jgi:hypothetical protein
MPPLKRPAEPATVDLPARKAIDAGEADVLIVGGGPAGIGAALGAAQAGVRVVLAEYYGFLGGNATAALVMPMATYHTQDRAEGPEEPANLFPKDHGEGMPIIGGALSLFVNRLVQSGGAIPPSYSSGYVVPFDPEVFKAVAFSLLDEAGVHFLLHSFASDVMVGPDSSRVVFETKSGPITIRARVIVDCTGDGDMAFRAGAPCQVGRELDGLAQPMTLMFLMIGFQRSAFADYVKAHPDQWHGVRGLWDLVKRAADAGELDVPRKEMLFFSTLHEDKIAVNGTRIIKVQGTDVWDLTYAEWEGRRQVNQIASFLTRCVPGFESAYVEQTGAAVGVRETRRILGEYVLTGDDVLKARKFSDVIAHGSYPIDIHNPTGPGTVLKHLPRGEYYDIPLRCLIPLEVENMVVAGRCISGTHDSLSSYRVMSISMATGQAAGVCAALSVRRQVPPRQITPDDVQRLLIDQKAILLQH